MKNDIIVTHADMRSLGYCNRGARQWAARHQLDWHRFIEQGLPASVFLATGDSMAEAVVAAAQARIDSEMKNGL